MVVYKRFQLALTGKSFVFWISGRLRELVVNGGSTVFGFLYHDNFHNELMRNEGQFFY